MLDRSQNLGRMKIRSRQFRARGRNLSLNSDRDRAWSPPARPQRAVACQFIISRVPIWSPDDKCSLQTRADQRSDLSRSLLKAM